MEEYYMKLEEKISNYLNELNVKIDTSEYKEVYGFSPKSKLAKKIKEWTFTIGNKDYNFNNMSYNDALKKALTIAKRGNHKEVKLRYGKELPK